MDIALSVYSSLEKALSLYSRLDSHKDVVDLIVSKHGTVVLQSDMKEVDSIDELAEQYMRVIDDYWMDYRFELILEFPDREGVYRKNYTR